MVKLFRKKAAIIHEDTGEHDISGLGFGENFRNGK